MSSKYDLAIVTGGSSGIGNSIIEGLCKVKPGIRIFNLSRRIPALFSIDQNLQHLDCDLSDRAQRSKVFDRLERELRHAEPKGRILLVNNAGFGLYGPLEANTPPQHLELLEVNICALVELTTRLLPLIKQHGGSIMNIASTSAFQPTPYLATYGASKAFVLNWTLALNDELRGSAASAIAVCPGPTQTEFFLRAGFSKSVVPAGYSNSPEQVASWVLKALDGKSSLLVTGFANKLAALFSSLLPLSLRTRIAGAVIRRFRQTPDSN